MSKSDIFKSIIWAFYEVSLAIVPVMIWIAILAFSAPNSSMSFEFPAFSFFCVSIWASCIREVPRVFGGESAKDRYERECGLALSLVGLIFSVICLVLAVLKSTDAISYLWGPFSFAVGGLMGFGTLMLFAIMTFKIQRKEFHRVV
ncbi:hypothetical protein [Marinobacter alkaliphilus]|uniref:Uncharacterized protein n=1 Tax=Marinobacter alkaliphilus TaxID=254719 RepID=A0ABZ3DYP0_9GAMM